MLSGGVHVELLCSFTEEVLSSFMSLRFIESFFKSGEEGVGYVVGLIQ